MMSSFNSGIYFSGAANLDSSFQWRVHLDELFDYDSKTPAQQNHYRFQAFDREKTVEFTRPQPKGLLLLCWVARQVFPWASDANALRFLQLSVHFLLCLLLTWSISELRTRLLVWVCFAANPVILSQASYPFYYFWQEIPSLWLVIRFFSKGRLSLALDGLAPLIHVLSVITRPSTLFVCLFYYAFIYFRRDRFRAVALFILVVAVLGIIRTNNPNPSQPWHSFYIGIGAYPNPYGLRFDDSYGFHRMKELTGVVMGSAVTRDGVRDPAIATHYYQTLKGEFMSIAKAHPFLLLRNAAYNYCLSFSIGYLHKPQITLISGILGLFVFLFLAYHRAYFWLFAHASAVMGFIAFIPPVVHYLYGAYLFSTVGMIVVALQQPWFARFCESLERWVSTHLPYLQPYFQKNAPSD